MCSIVVYSISVSCVIVLEVIGRCTKTSAFVFLAVICWVVHVNVRLCRGVEIYKIKLELVLLDVTN